MNAKSSWNNQHNLTGPGKKISAFHYSTLTLKKVIPQKEKVSYSRSFSNIP